MITKQKAISYDIRIVSIPSNLGKGRMYYFICPFTHKWCKYLYMGYGSPYFKSREAYSHRIYYASQLSSRLNKPNDIYWRLERQLEVLRPLHPKNHYKGTVTKAQQRIARLEQKKYVHDEIRWRVFDRRMLKFGIRF